MKLQSKPVPSNEQSPVEEVVVDETVDNKENEEPDAEGKKAVVEPKEPEVKTSEEEKTPGKSVATPKVPLVVVSEDESENNESSPPTLNEKEAEEILNAEEVEKDKQPAALAAGEEDGDKEEPETVFDPSELFTEKQSEEAFEDLDEKLSESFFHDDIRDRKLPDTLFGVQVLEVGSATMGNQVVIHSEIIKMNKTVKSMVDENNYASGHVKAIHDMFKNFMESEKAADKVWKNELKTNMEAEMADAKKEYEQKQAEVVRELRTLKEAFADKKENVENQEEGSEGPKAVKRASTTTIDESVPKIARSDENTPTPAEKWKAAMAAKEKKKKTPFSCVLCVGNDHRTINCDRYPNTESRKSRMDELHLCSTCARSHAGLCRFSAPRECEVCREKHLNFLCKTFD